MKSDPNWSKWVEWLGEEPKPGTISKDVYGMLAARQIWESFQEIVRVAPEEARKYGTFHSWFNASYLQAQGLAIRRQVEVSNDVVSLGRLLDRIAESRRAPYLASGTSPNTIRTTIVSRTSSSTRWLVLERPRSTRAFRSPNWSAFDARRSRSGPG